MDLHQDARDALLILETYVTAPRGVTTRDAKAAIGRLRAAVVLVEKNRWPGWEKLAAAIRPKIDLAEVTITGRSG